MANANTTGDNAEFWDSPGSSISYVKMAAAVTGTRPDRSADRTARGSADQAGATVRAAAGEPAGKPTARGAAADARSRRTAAAGRVAGEHAG